MTKEILASLLSPERAATSINDALTRGVVEILPDRESLEAVMRGNKIRLYLGIDPTSPDLHIGHTVPLRKLRQFQDLGHDVILLFGTFTGMIGDPTDKSASRVRLTREQIEGNVSSYADQASRILDMSKDAPNPVTILYNHEWLGELKFEQVVDIASNFTISEMLDRSMFQRRLEEGKPPRLHEILYPLMQGYDSVAMNVDLEVGGSDQTFNMLVGRDLMKVYGGKEKWVMATRLISDPAGNKMGKTEGNIVNVRDLPEVKYEAIMSWPDTAIGVGFELLTNVPMSVVKRIQDEILPQSIEGGSEIGIVALKEALAFRVVAELDGEPEARFAMEEFDRVKRKKKFPRRMREISVPRGSLVEDILVASGLVKDVDEARARIAQGSVVLGEQPVRRSMYANFDSAIISIGKNPIRLIARVNTKK